MVLFTDGGSTKCDWVLLDDQGEQIFKTTTQGLNPNVVTREELVSRISTNEDLKQVFEVVRTLDFYGAGCGTATPRNTLREVMKKLFPNAEVNVAEDTWGAVLAVTTKPGIVCIMGTGSNSCYFDGNDIHVLIPSLGYIVMDEASGNYYGKKLLQDFFYRQMPEDVAVQFTSRFNVDPDTIKLNLYAKPNPNAYLASYARIIFEDVSAHPYFEKLVADALQDFAHKRISIFEQAQEVPIHFVGSIAYFAQKQVREMCKQNNFEVGNIIQKPIEGLIKHYRKKIQQKNK